MLADNIKYLKQNNELLYQRILEKKSQHENIKVIVEDSRTAVKTIKYINGEKEIYLHSKYNPLNEAKLIIDKIENTEKIDENSYVVFYGLGLGYHIDLFANRHPSVTFSIYEPSLEILTSFLNEKSITRNWNKLDLFGSVAGQYELDQVMSRAMLDHKKNLIIVALPVYEQLFQEAYQYFLNKLKENIRLKRLNFATTFSHKKRWVFNGVKNLKNVLKTPNIVLEAREKFYDKTAILVSAGPSLNFEIDNLKWIKENKDAVIFSVGSSNNTMLEKSIKPDAICSFDPTVRNQRVFKKLLESGITDIPMVFGSSIGYEVLELYQGPKLHMIINRDTVGQYLLKPKHNIALKVLHDVPSIAVLTIELLHELGFTQIILVGQNLAFFQKRKFAEGIDYHTNPIDEKNSEYLDVLDVEGNTIKTDRGYFSMKIAIEKYIKDFHLNVVNTTVGGAHIEGTIFKPLSEIMKSLPDKRPNQSNPLLSIIKSDFYDCEYLQTKLIELENSYSQYYKILRMILDKIGKLEKLVKDRNKNQANVMHKRLDEITLSLEECLYYSLVALPMNASEFSIVRRKVDIVRNDPNTLKKLENLLPVLKNYIQVLLSDREVNDELMEVLSELKLEKEV